MYKCPICDRVHGKVNEIKQLCGICPSCEKDIKDNGYSYILYKMRILNELKEEAKTKGAITPCCNNGMLISWWDCLVKYHIKGEDYFVLYFNDAEKSTHMIKRKIVEEVYNM